MPRKKQRILTTVSLTPDEAALLAWWATLLRTGLALDVSKIPKKTRDFIARTGERILDSFPEEVEPEGRIELVIAGVL